MTQWKMVKWDTVLSIKNGKSQKNVVAEDGRYPIYGSGGVMGYANDFLCDENTVVLGRKGSINSPIFVKEKFWNVDTAFGLVANKEFLIPKFLYYFCISYDFEKLNTTVTIPSLTKSNLLSVLIPLPPLDIQKQIVARLELAQTMIDQRKQQLGLMDSLIQSTFYEMFGDPVKNEKGWETIQFGNAFKISSGCFLPAKDMDSDGGIPVYGGNGVNGYHSSYMFEDRKLVIGRVGAYCGAVHITEPFSWITDNALIIKEMKTEFNLFFLFSLLSLLNLNQFANTSGQPSISQTGLAKVSVLTPPLLLQRQFAKRVERIEALKQQMTASLTELEQNFNALMQQSFAG